MTHAFGSPRGTAGAMPVRGRAATGPPVVGRDGLLRRARRHLDGGGSVLLTGPAGIGKSTLLSALAEGFTEDRVLRCSPSEAEHHLPFLGLIDLLADTGDILATLPGNQRTLLEAALLRRTDPVGERAVLGLRVAVLSTFRALCAERPVLLVIDNAQWLDPPSAELLAFIARRASGLPLRAMVSLRTAPGEPQGQAPMCPPPVLALPVPPMTAAEVVELLGRMPVDGAPGRSGLPRTVLAKVHRTSGGNPFFALELGRALAYHGDRLDPAAPLPVPDSLRCLMLDRLRALSDGAQRTLLIAAAAARPTLPLLRAAGRREAAAEIAEAVRAGIAARDLTARGPGTGSRGEVVRFTHPLLSAVLYAEAPERERLSAHAALTEAVTDPVERARHLALLSPDRDPKVAATLGEAAVAARRRGAPGTAARLGVLAADRSTEWPAEVGYRLTAADDALAAGEFAMARGIAYDVLERASGPAERVRAWIVVLDSSGQALAELDDVFTQAFADAHDDPALLAPLHYRLAWRAWMVKGSVERARQEAATAALLAAEAGDRRTEVLALTKQALAEFNSGRPEAERTLARALAGPHEPRIMVDHNGPVYLRYRHHLLGDRLAEARSELRALTYAVRQRGAVESLSMCLYGCAQVEMLRGRCDRALDLAYQCLRLAEDSELSQGPAWCAVAFTEAAGGSLDRAHGAAESAVCSSEDDGDLLFLPVALHAMGRVALLRGDVATAAATLRRVRRIETAQGLAEPGFRRWHADIAEALAAAGAVAEAAAVVEDTRRLAVRLGRRSVLAVLERSAALVAAARGDMEAAWHGMRRAVTAAAALPYPLEEGRARLELGRLLLGCGDTVAARKALRSAHRVFARAKAAPWIAAVNVEIDRLETGVPAAPNPMITDDADPLHSLAGVERPVAALVAEGATNREIAARLFVSVKTVEAALTRTYRKLGVRSRVDLARMAAARRP